MKTITKNVYYCEFCNMHRLSSYTVKSHETRCTLNPNRSCGMPACGGLVSEDFIAELIKYAVANVVTENQGLVSHYSYTSIPEEFVARLMDELECPWCVFAILRIGSKRRPELHISWTFDFKAAAKALLDEARQEEMANIAY